VFQPFLSMASITAAQSMYNYVIPVVQTLSVVAALACVFFIVNGGIQYMTSRGKPDNLDHAKRVLKNALIGLVLVLGAATLTTILSHAYPGTSASSTASLPILQTITPNPNPNGLVDILMTAVTGFLDTIIQTVGSPFISALSYFTMGTPILEQNAAVFNLWLTMVGVTDALFILVIALLGFHVMSATTFGFAELDMKHLLPRIGLVFLLVNTSIFIIDGVIGISNALIDALNVAGGNITVWNTLTNIIKQADGQSFAALLLMIFFLIFVVILLIYYVTRLVTLFIGAVLSPLIMVLWIVPGFRDFSETAAKVYITTIFVLFVHVVILELAASLFAGITAMSPNDIPNTFMAMIVGLATILALLKTQGVMNQLSYVSLGPRTARQLGGQFINAVSAVNNVRRGVAVSAVGAASLLTSPSSPSMWTPRYGNGAGQPVEAKSTSGAGHSTNAKQNTKTSRPTPSVTVTRIPASPRSALTGSTTVAPKIKPDLSSEAKVSRPISRSVRGGKK
jgi:hypothetical protein